ncbi:hypothetical protein Vafri_19343 [Volvox africanus]|uniref:EF-hand domain-containing protein n=1 Tax=Volvox africanus TaxID=51714 RepID=A0A8J4F8K1_9CHLO|nr:hypothetical protein Vafri_19343 [Volvox africanus]
MASAEARASAGAGPQELHPTLKKDLFQVNADLYTAVSLWLRKHGKGVKPKLSDEQKQQMKECFELMDQDGSGAIDAEELGAAFKLLGIRMKRTELAQLLAEVDHDGSGEVEYPEFLEIMTVTLQRLAEEDDSDKNEGQVPFGLMATAYRRKRLMEGIINGHKEVQAQIQQISDKANLEALQATKAAEMEAMRAKAGDANSSGGSSGGGGNGVLPSGRSTNGSIAGVRRLAQADMSKSLLEALGPDERRIVNALASRTSTSVQQPAMSIPRSSPSPPLSSSVRPYSHYANSPSHRQLIDTPQLLDLRFVHQSTIRLPPGAGGFSRSLSGALIGSSNQGPVGMGAGCGGGGGGGGGGGSTGISHATYGIMPARDSASGAPYLTGGGGGSGGALRRSASNMRLGSPITTGAGAGAMSVSGNSGAAPMLSPGRATRGEDGVLPLLRNEGSSAPYPLPPKQPLSVRLGMHSARQAARGSSS